MNATILKGSEESIKFLLDAINSALIIILATSLYVDCLPAPVIRAMEIISKERRLTKENERQRMMAIINCGFPEPHHNSTAIEICRIFAKKSGFRWLGGLSLGSGGAIAGKKLTETVRVGRHAIRALDITATALAGNKPIPAEAVSLMAKPSIPTWLYRAVGNYGWRRQAKLSETTGKLYQRPYDKP